MIAFNFKQKKSAAYSLYVSIFSMCKKWNNSPKEKDQAGFTLMEVMVALAIVSIGLITATVTFTQSTKSANQLEKIMAADLAARNLMDRYRIPYKEKRIPEYEEDTVRQAGYELPYKQIITPAAMEGLKKVDITVYDNDKKTVLRKLSMYATTK